MKLSGEVDTIVFTHPHSTCAAYKTMQIINSGLPPQILTQDKHPCTPNSDASGIEREQKEKRKKENSDREIKNAKERNSDSNRMSFVTESGTIEEWLDRSSSDLIELQPTHLGKFGLEDGHLTDRKSGV